MISKRCSRILVFALCALPAIGSMAAEVPSVASLYAEHCAQCHGAERLGGMGPALLPENLGRLKRGEALGVIRDGRMATQMPAFKDKLSEEQIKQLAELIYTPLAQVPRWDLEQMRASQLRHVQPGEQLADKPVFKVKDPLNLFIVVELGDHHATLLDGDRFVAIKRFPPRFALHGGPKYSPDGRYVYFASRDGWVSKFDIYNLKYIAEIRAGINTRNLAASGDGRYVLVGNYLPHTLVVLDARDLSPLKGIAATGPFPVRRIKLDDYLDDFFFDPPYNHLIGAARNGKNGQVVNLLVGRKIADVELPGLPHLGR